MRLRVGVDGRAFSSVAAGVRRYVWELYGAMATVDPSVDVVAVGAPDHTALPPGIARHKAMSVPTNLGWMIASIPLAARSARLDVYHAPAYTAPLWGVHPQILTIHDVSYERVPDWDAYKNGVLRRMFYRRAALAADRIVTDSQFSRTEIKGAYGIPLDRIDVVPLAASDTFTPGPFDPGAAPPGVRQPYALHVGDLQIRRNLTTALAAVCRVRLQPDRDARPDRRVRLQPDRPALTLVCAGVDRGIGESLRAQATQANDPGALVLTGAVTDEVLLNLYRGASMLLYPSRYEGFGLPILEAMRCGVPVIGSTCASIPELVADAGLLLDPLDTGAWTQAIARVMTDPAHRAALSDAGLRWAPAFTWTRTAAETLNVLRRTARLREGYGGQARLRK